MLRGITPTESTLSLNDCTLRNNVALSDSGVIDSIGASVIAIDSVFTENESGNVGGVAYIDGVSHFKNCNFQANYADYAGGALFIPSGDSKTTIKDCDFVNNCVQSDGGAVSIGGEDARLEGCSFTANYALNWGGAIILYSGNTEIQRCNFMANSAGDRGGAIFSFRENTKMHSCNFESNGAAHAGAVYLRGGVADIVGSTFEGNAAAGSGGAIMALDATHNCRNCVFTRNSADSDGGAIFVGGANGNCAFSGCHFNDNEALQGGGAVYSRSGSLTITATTFECNTAFLAGGVFSYRGEIEIAGSEFNNNVAGGGGALVLSSSRTEVSRCLFDGNEALAFGGGAIASLTGRESAINLTTFQNNTSFGPTYPSHDIHVVFRGRPIQCGSGFQNCFCNAVTNPSVGTNITTNDLPTTCAGAGTGPACPGCRFTDEVSCSADSQARLPMSKSDVDPFETSETVSPLEEMTPPNDVEKMEKKLEDIKAKRFEKMGGR